MMRRFLAHILSWLLFISPAIAADNYTATAGSGLTFAAKNVGGVFYPWWIPADSTGVAFGVTGNPFFVTNNGTFAVQATLQASGSTAIGKVDPNTIATWGLAAASQNVAAPTNGWLPLCQFTTSPTTISTTNVSPIQCDNANNVLVKVSNTLNAVTPADNVANTAGSPVWSQGALWDSGGTQWVRAPGTAAAGAQVNVKSGGIASGAIASGAIASGAIASGAVASGAFASGSFLNATAGDPCMFQAKSNFAISTASGTFALVAGVSAKKIYVCSLSLITTTAVSVSLAEGSSATCGTSAQAAVIGVATNGTAANGMPLAANGGLTLGNGGGTVAQTATAANALCLFQSGTSQIAGNITYVQQ